MESSQSGLQRALKALTKATSKFKLGSLTKGGSALLSDLSSSAGEVEFVGSNPLANKRNSSMRNKFSEDDKPNDGYSVQHTNTSADQD